MSDPLAAFREAYQEWERAILQPTLRRAPERDADFTTVSMSNCSLPPRA